MLNPQGVTAMTTAERSADKAMGIELMAIEVEDQLEWAEAQRRTDDAARLRGQLVVLLNELADVAESIPTAA